MNNLLNIKSFLKFLSRNKGVYGDRRLRAVCFADVRDPDCGVCGTGIEYRQTAGELRPDRRRRQ